MRPSTERLGLALLLGAALAFHAATLGGQSLFVDEVAEWQHARGTWTEVAFRADSMPPTFNLLVAAWSRVIGEGTSGRFLSVAFSLGATLLVWRIGRRIGRACRVDAASAGLAAAIVFTALPLQLYYAQLIRGYALMTFAAALAILLFLRAAQDDRPKDWAAFAAAGVFGMWCHYYFAITLVLLLGVLLWRRGPRLARSPLLAGVAIIVGCLPLLPFLQEDFGYQHDLREPRPLSAAAIGYTGFSYFSGYTLGPSKADLHQISGTEAAREAAPWSAVLALALAPLLGHGGRRLQVGGWLVPMLTLTFGPVVLVGLLGLVSGITYNPRFVVWAVVPIALWVGIGVVEGLGRRGRARAASLGGCLVLSAIAAIAVAQRHAVNRYKTEDLASAAAWLAENTPDDETVFVVSDYLAPQLAFNAEIAGLKMPTLTALPRPGEFDVVVTDTAIAEQAIDHLRDAVGAESFWLVESRTFHTDPDGRLHSAIEDAAKLEPVARFAGVQIYRGTLEAE